MPKQFYLNIVFFLISSLSEIVLRLFRQLHGSIVFSLLTLHWSSVVVHLAKSHLERVRCDIDPSWMSREIRLVKDAVENFLVHYEKKNIEFLEFFLLSSWRWWTWKINIKQQRKIQIKKGEPNEGIWVDACLSTLLAILFGQNMSRDTVIHLCLWDTLELCKHQPTPTPGPFHPCLPCLLSLPLCHLSFRGCVGGNKKGSISVSAPHAPQPSH